MTARVIVCYSRCEPCQFGQCPGGDHRWAGVQDIDHAEAIGRPETANGRCACPCTQGPVLDQEENQWVDADGWGPLESLSLEPCPVCGSTTACGYDGDGLPLIHSLPVGEPQ